MPFIRKTDSQGSQPPTDTRKLFIGRTGELLFFVQNILKPEEPTHNIISIWGQGGVGKSTLLSRFIDEAHSAEFEDYCQTALVDERQTTPLSIMEKFADQLHMKGEFEKALKRYKEALRKLQTERQTMQDAVLNRVPDFAGAAAEMVPVVGPLLREGAKATAGLYLDKRQKVQGHRNAELLEDPLKELTRTFVKELNQLAESQVLLGSKRVKNLRVILFFDTFEQLATEAAPWLLNYFLPADIKSNIVLVIAGRDPIERSLPEDTKHWLPYCDNETIYWIPLNSFTEDETRAYLTKRDITDPERIATIWQLSQGLPLYLSLLTSNPSEKVDPTADVVANFLRWIPKEEQIKRQLALDAALFSRPFNQDDLAAFTYLPKKDLLSLYNWLIAQPFVRSQDGRYSYHDLARELFSRHLYQRSKKEYYATCRTLVTYYERLLSEIKEIDGKQVYQSTEWIELMLAIAYQLFLLPDEVSHIRAIEQVLYVYKYTEQLGEIVRLLRELPFKRSNNQTNTNAVQIVEQLQQYIQADVQHMPSLSAANYILEKVVYEQSFPKELLAHVYTVRGWAYLHLTMYLEAIADFDRAIELDPAYAAAYGGKGWACYKLKEYQQALESFNHVLELNPHDPLAYMGRIQVYWDLNEYDQALAQFDHPLELALQSASFYCNRGWAYSGSKKYQEAIADFDRAIELDPNYDDAYNARGWTYSNLREYQRALTDFDRAIELDPYNFAAYNGRGWVYMCLKDYQQAIAVFDDMIILNPSLSWVFAERSTAYLWMKNIEQAKSDYKRAKELDPKFISHGWMVEWIEMCLKKPDSGMASRLEAMAALNPQNFRTHICMGIACWLRSLAKEALTELEEATVEIEKARPGAEELRTHFFWKGMTFVSLNQYKEAITEIEKAMEYNLPPILLTPLCWFEQDRPDFFQNYVVPLLARYDLV